MTLRGLDRGVAIALLLVLAFLTTLTVVDLYNLATRTSDYAQVYGFTGAERAWSHRNEGNYIAGSVLRLAFFVAGVGVAAWSLRSRRPSSARALYLYILVAVVLLAVNYVQWWRSGFDH